MQRHAEEVTDLGDRHVVASSLDFREEGFRLRLQLGLGSVFDVGPHELAACDGASDRPDITGVVSEPLCLTQGAEGLVVASLALVQDAQVEQDRRALGRGSSQERIGPPEQGAGRSEIAAVEGSPARDGEPGRRPLARPLGALVAQGELRPKMRCLFEVVADDLVELAFTTACRGLVPRGVSDVEVGACLLRDPRICRVADQQVSEREAILAGEQRLARTDQVASHERRQTLGEHQAIAFRRERCHRPAVEPLVLDGRVLEHGQLVRREPLEARLDQRGHGRRHRERCQIAACDPAVPVRDERRVFDEHRDEVLHEQRDPLGDRRDPVGDLLRDTGEQLFDETLGLVG